jgi:hypothetical protein
LNFFQQGLIEKFSAGFDFEISNAIVIAIELVNRIEQGLIENGLNESAFVYDDAPRASLRTLVAPPVAMTTNYR